MKSYLRHSPFKPFTDMPLLYADTSFCYSKGIYFWQICPIYYFLPLFFFLNSWWGLLHLKIDFKIMKLLSCEFIQRFKKTRKENCCSSNNLKKKKKIVSISSKLNKVIINLSTVRNVA